MKIRVNKCANCRLCIPYCPVNAIAEDIDGTIVDQQLCVECRVCQKSGVCKSEAFYQPELKWPRILRAYFSDPLVCHPTTGICGRGTTEVKTNDVSGRIGFDEVGIVIEVGRPSISSDFDDIEKIVQVLWGKVTFASQNPLTSLLDNNTGLFSDRTLLGERVLSVIIECKTTEANLLNILKELETIGNKINTVFSLGIVSRYRGEEVLAYNSLVAAGYDVKINGKVNVGLGRPLK